ncbi:MAG: DUF6174 domain-containing protein [Oleiphilus sp.]
MLKSLLILSLFVFIIGCSNSQNSNEYETNLVEIQKNIESNKALWLSANLADYMFTYSAINDDCPSIDVFPPVIITVETGEVASVYVPAFNEYAPNIDSWPTITELFNLMLSNVESKPLNFSLSPFEINELPEFNAVYGYPINFYINQTKNECDAVEYSVTGFQ